MSTARSHRADAASAMHLRKFHQCPTIVGPREQGRTALTIVFVACLLAACSTQSQVARRRGDTVEEGRSISPEAYAWFTRGLYHERAGRNAQAARDFGAAVNADRKSGLAWAAWGRVTCALNPGLAGGIFRAGLARAERKAPLLLERARCQLETALLLTSETGEETTLPASAALKDAQAALSFEPRNPQVSLLLSVCFHAAGEPEKAERVERGYRLLSGEPSTEEEVRPIDAVDRALVAGDLKEAAQRALTVFTPGELAARATLWGQRDIARKQALFVLAADPDDVNALVTLQVLNSENPSENEADSGGLSHTLGDENLVGLSASAVVLLHRYLLRRIGPDTAAAFLDQHLDLIQKARDPLLDRFMEDATEALF